MKEVPLQGKLLLYRIDTGSFSHMGNPVPIAPRSSSSFGSSKYRIQDLSHMGNRSTNRTSVVISFHVNQGSSKWMIEWRDWTVHVIRSQNRVSSFHSTRKRCRRGGETSIAHTQARYRIHSSTIRTSVVVGNDADRGACYRRHMLILRVSLCCVCYFDIASSHRQSISTEIV